MQSNQPFIVRKAAVLGAGVMGAQIAAHLVNANVAGRCCSNCPPRRAIPTAIVQKAIDEPREARAQPARDASRARR